jgi:hypothetical protein
MKPVSVLGARMPPKKHTVIRTLLHVTTALYSMAGLGRLEESTAFKEIKKGSAVAAEAEGRVERVMIN